MTFKKVPVLQAGCNESVHSRDVLSVNLPHKGREEKKRGSKFLAWLEKEKLF